MLRAEEGEFFNFVVGRKKEKKKASSLSHLAGTRDRSGCPTLAARSCSVADSVHRDGRYRGRHLNRLAECLKARASDSMTEG